MIKVFQAISFRDACLVDDDVLVAKANFLDGKYHEVADVDTNDLEVAFEKTNTISCYWWDNEEVTKRFEGEGTRSTNPGDIMLDENNQYWLVADFGFKELPPISLEELKK